MIFVLFDYLKNPVVLIVLGILLIPAMGIGIIFIIIGIVILGKEKKAIAANEDLFVDIVSALEENGYEMRESEVKRNIVSAFVFLNEKPLGEVFLVAPGWKYAQFRRMENVDKPKYPRMTLSYWPYKSLIGAWLGEPTENYSEKKEFLSKFQNIFHEKLSKGNT